MNCKNCEKKIPKARVKAIPDTEYCVNCADEFGTTTAAIPIFGEEFQDIAIVKNADPGLVERINKLTAYENSVGNK